jgi:pimeloyl-ACP methyl ester carboxylesterase
MAVRVPVHAGGHSQGGMVVTAALEQITGRVRELVCLDAFVPAGGDCAGSGRDADLADLAQEAPDDPVELVGRSRFG